jgi:predicted ABC-type ATPase
MNESPICYIIAGPNGAGKTTFAAEFLPKVAECDIFVNADLIAKGLSPFNPESDVVLAGRLMIELLERYSSGEYTFAFETTLSGRSYLERIKKMKANGYTIVIFYIMLENVEVSIGRIQERVAKGGHHISDEDAIRRFPRTMSNFINEYSLLADYWKVYDNSQDTMALVAEKGDNGIIIVQPELYKVLQANGTKR